VSPLPAGVHERELTAPDIPQTVALIARCDATYADWAGVWNAPASEEETERWELLLERSDSWARGAFAGGTLVGAVAWRQAEEKSGAAVPGVAHVVSVFTDPDWWGRGIASHLLSAAEEAMRVKAYRYARLWTPRDAPAREFYVREGWTLDGRAKWEPKFALHLVGYEKPLG
jgi:GNAT superfamily N-acetyltransferase